MSVIYNLRELGLTVDQLRMVESLTGSLTPDQALWLSGYLAGLHRGARSALAGEGEALASFPSTSAMAGASANTRSLTVLVGSETGNARALAKSLVQAAGASGLQASLADLAGYPTRKLKDEQDLLIITSTHGEGDPPQSALGFFEFLEGRKAPKLGQVRYAVLALGDSTYEFYCEAGKRIDRRLAELGAARIAPRVDCDVDYDKPAADWIKTVIAAIAPDAGGATSSTVFAKPLSAPAAVPVHDKRNPFAATVIDNIALTGRRSSKETRHIEFSLDGSGLSFAPGDALGILPRNDPALVEDILQTLSLSADAPVTLDDSPTSLGEALTGHFDISASTPRFIDRWAELSGASALAALKTGDQSQRAAFLRDHHVIDILRQYPVAGVAPQAFLSGLRPLQPRLYSIASSQAYAPDEVHLTVTTLRYALHGEARTGVASGHLAERVKPDDTLPVYVQANPHFRLPEDDAPIVMIGAGTGVAPYRAFLQEREIRGARGRSWLFFGERNFHSDFLYQTEWQALLKSGVLHRMSVAFSRDRAEKVYVQHRLQEHGAELYGWMQEGAHIYVCGDAANLAPDVHRTLRDIVQQKGGLSQSAADEYLGELQRGQRYQVDVY
ncbi:MAG TPA: assimilatory sulfite reductase (NADPH) flavoprotein subunit [Dongiaceae bacterium]|nr:assimilatory sulfite reductase (NADPH) flavoprotein subunit [Dongiaceae bacterium]